MTTPVQETFWQEVQADFYAVEQWAVTEATDALSAAKTILGNIWSTVGPDQLGIIAKVALSVENAMNAGATFDTAMVAGLNELVTDEKAEVTKIETSLLNSLVVLHIAKA